MSTRSIALRPSPIRRSSSRLTRVNDECSSVTSGRRDPVPAWRVRDLSKGRFTERRVNQRRHEEAGSIARINHARLERVYKPVGLRDAATMTRASAMRVHACTHLNEVKGHGVCLSDLQRSLIRARMRPLTKTRLRFRPIAGAGGGRGRAERATVG